jgi:hypothetical protein
MTSGFDAMNATIIEVIKRAGEPKNQLERMALDGLRELERRDRIGQLASKARVALPKRKDVFRYAMALSERLTK